MKAEVPWFPCWGVRLNNNNQESSELIKKFLKIRPSSRWLLLSKFAAVSERHLWSAWHLIEENFRQKSSLSNNPDAEFIRVISGTNQLKTAFKRGGINETDRESWLIFLPSRGKNLNKLPILDYDNLIKEVQTIMYKLDASLLPERPKPTKLGADRLGIPYEGNLELISEDLFISHLAKSSLST